MKLVLTSLFLGLILAVAAAAAFGQELLIERDFQANPWTRPDVKNGAGRFHFAIVADRAGGNRPGVFEEAVKKLNLMQPAFVLSVGDLQEGYTSDPELYRSFWDKLTGLVEGLEMPFFYLPGNHDLATPALRQEWIRRFGRDYYHFVYRDVLFLCLNSQDLSGAGTGEAQTAYIRKALGANPHVRWTLLFLHQPLWMNPGLKAWGEIEAMLEDRPYTVFAGHRHTYYKTVRKGRDHIMLATTGAGSQLRGPLFGEFDQIAWVSMTEDGPRVANLRVDGILGQEVRTPSTEDRFGAFSRGTAVKLLPLVFTTPSFVGGITQLMLKNDAELAMNYQAFFEPHAQLRLEPNRLNIMLPPKSERALEVKVGSGEPLLAENLTPPSMHWAAYYELPGEGPATFDGTSRLIIERRPYECPRRTGPVVLDGRLDEWPVLPFFVRDAIDLSGLANHRWTGPEDLSFRFGTAYDDENLYIAVDVTDDHGVFDQHLKHWEQDGLEVWIDAAPSAGRRVGNVLYLGFTPGDTAEPAYIDERERLSPGVRIASRRHASGHSTEIAVPATLLGQGPDKTWREFRLNVGAIDRDPNEWALRIRWRPQWGTANDFAGSGTFRRQQSAGSFPGSSSALLRPCSGQQDRGLPGPTQGGRCPPSAIFTVPSELSEDREWGLGGPARR